MIELRKNKIDVASSLLKAGGLIAFPTETVYGLGVVFDDRAAYDRLIQVKKRPPEKPFTLMCSDVKDIKKYARINETASKLIEAFMPGQFTIILKAKSSLPPWCVSSEGMVGIRIPDDKVVREMIKLTGKPLLVPSANKSGQPPLCKDVDVIKVFENEIDAIILGESRSNKPSTIVIVNDDSVNVARVGKISKERIKKVLKEN